MREIDQSGLNLTSEEKRLFSSLFLELDTTDVGVITAEIGRPFLLKSGLPVRVLRSVWSIADFEDCGFLTPRAFCVALRIIGHVQAGAVPSRWLLDQRGPLPKFQGYTDYVDAHPVAASGTPSEPPPPYPGEELHVPSLSLSDLDKYVHLFFECKDRFGLVQGDKVREIYSCSKLPNEKLRRIWDLADSHDRGALDMSEFIVATHLVVSCAKGFLRDVPSTLPTSLLKSAARRPERSSSASPNSAARRSGPTATRLQGPVSRVQTSLSHRSNSMSNAPSSAMFSDAHGPLDHGIHAQPRAV